MKALEKSSYIRKIAREISRYLKALADLVLPRQCIVCSRNLDIDEKHICLVCLAELPLTYYWLRPHNPMADRFNELLQERLEDYEGYASACSLFYYNAGDNFRHITHSVKYNGNAGAGSFFGEILGEFIAESQTFKDVDLIIPVPLHWSRKFKRGYNQAEIIAKGIGKKLHIVMEPKLLIRKKRTKSQTTLDVPEKKTNVKNAFDVNQDKKVRHKNPRHILIVDDVFTTGATLQSCHYALRKHYGKETKISIATLGFVHS